MNSKTKILIIVILVIALVCGIFLLAKNKSAKPSKYDALANALTESGAKFYGAFWCPHCQKEKAWFGTSAKLLPYVECSNPDHTQTQICVDKKIESYPTWIFNKEIVIKSTKEPIVCKPGEQTPEENIFCSRVKSQYFKQWYFPENNMLVASSSDPSILNGIYTFPNGSQLRGEIELENLAKQINFVLQ